MMALKGMKMNNKFLFDCIKEEFGRELRTDINYPFGIFKLFFPFFCWQ
jgi:hypothetical protein